MLFFGVLWSVYTVIMFFLFCCQSVHYNGGYPSDMAAYIDYIQSVSTGYQFPYPIMFWLGKVFNLFLSPQYAMAVSVTLLNSIAHIALKYYINQWSMWRNVVNPPQIICLNVLLFSLLFVSMLFFPVYRQNLYWYRGVNTPNPFHNATYLAARGFAVITFALFMQILIDFDKKADYRKYIYFAISLLVTTMTKPSFTFFLICSINTKTYLWE